VFLAGTAAVGIGVGLSFMASTALVNQIAPPERRAEVMAAYFASGYCGPSPVVAIGPTSAWIGTADATLGCALATAALAAATLLGRIRHAEDRSAGRRLDGSGTAFFPWALLESGVGTLEALTVRAATPGLRAA
jgi:MFS family permease